LTQQQGTIRALNSQLATQIRITHRRMQIKSRTVEDRVKQLLSVVASILHLSEGDSTLRTGGVTISGVEI